MENDGKLADATSAWIQDVADRQYGGNWGAAAANILEAAHAAELSPDDPWAYITARQRGQSARSPG